jgi:hypothetical protein
MYTNSIIGVTGLLVAAVAAIPKPEFQHHHMHQHQQHHHKRDIVWITEYQEVVEVIPVTKTVWVKPGEAVPTAYSTDVPADVQPAAASSPVPSPPVAAYDPPAAESQAVADTPAPVYEAPSAAPVSSEAAAAPVASSYVAPAPVAAPSAEAVAAAPAASSEPAYQGGSDSGSSDSGSSSGGQTYTGDLTWYEVGLGACGITSTSDEHVVAISHELFDAVSTGNPNTNPLCNKKVSIIGANGQTYTGTIVDRCPGCDSGSLDLSQSFFNEVTNNGDGRVGGMKWSMAS